jgi:predicted acyl esterase
LRWTTTQEWHDIYQKENIDDLQKFLDKYMRGIDNDWEKTPKIRQSMLGYNRPSVVNRPALEYPPADFDYHTFFLDAGIKTLSKSKPNSSSSAEYHAESRTDEGATFTYKFDRYTELCGISKTTLYMSTEDSDDMVSYELLIDPVLLTYVCRTYTLSSASWISMVEPYGIRTFL